MHETGCEGKCILVHTEDPAGVAFDNQVLEIGDLIVAPKHGNTL